MKHEHKECEHKEIKYCRKCDVVYCFSCTKEWVVSTVGGTFVYTAPSFEVGTHFMNTHVV